MWIHLWLKSSEKTYWMVTLRRGGDPTSYTNRSGIDVSDPIGLPKLNALSELPGWLRKVEKKIGASFPPSKLEIKAGRHRKLVGELRSWLES